MYKRAYNVYNYSEKLCLQTSVCRDIVDQLGEIVVNSRQRRVVMVSQDSFYRELTKTEWTLAERGEFNFDHPGQRELVHVCVKLTPRVCVCVCVCVCRCV